MTGTRAVGPAVAAPSIHQVAVTVGTPIGSLAKPGRGSHGEGASLASPAPDRPARATTAPQRQKGGPTAGTIAKPAKHRADFGVVRGR